MENVPVDELKTPLYDIHIAAGGRMVPFAGYLLPVRYETGIIAEHNAVRTAAGLFDVSHMGEIMLTGAGAFNTIQNVFTNDFTTLPDGGMRYSLICNHEGGVIDDIIVYRMNVKKFIVVVNASNRKKDYDWIRSHLSPDTLCEDISDETAQIALQGPSSSEILARVCKMPPSQIASFKGVVGNAECLISVSGYTGEHGYEIYMDPDDAPGIWAALIDAGSDLGLIPCGLGARDTLRLEASMPLYGHELSENITPFEASLGRYVKLDKVSFIGKEALEAAGVSRRIRVGIEIIDRGIAREECEVYAGDEAGEKPVGRTTSGTMCPYVGKALAMAMIDREFSEPGNMLKVDVRGRKLNAVVVKMPFYKRK